MTRRTMVVAGVVAGFVAVVWLLPGCAIIDFLGDEDTADEAGVPPDDSASGANGGADVPDAGVSEIAIEVCDTGDCGCPPGQVCGFECPQGDCSFECAPGAECLFLCNGGGCNMRCREDSTCEHACDGGGCTVTCEPLATCAEACFDPGACSRPLP